MGQGKPASNRSELPPTHCLDGPDRARGCDRCRPASRREALLERPPAAYADRAVGPPTAGRRACPSPLLGAAACVTLEPVPKACSRLAPSFLPARLPARLHPHRPMEPSSLPPHSCSWIPCVAPLPATPCAQAAMMALTRAAVAPGRVRCGGGGGGGPSSSRVLRRAGFQRVSRQRCLGFHCIPRLRPPPPLPLARAPPSNGTRRPLCAWGHALEEMRSGKCAPPPLPTVCA